MTIHTSRYGRFQRPLPAACRALVAVLLAALALAATLATASAASSGWLKSDFVRVRLISAVDGTGALDTIPLGVEVALDDGWKTYWRSPGDAGLPPALEWAGSSNLKSATLLYPKPRRLTLLGLQTFGYKHTVIFPVDARPETKGQPLALRLKLDLLVCAELCVPRTFDLGLTIPAGPATPGPEAQSIAKARAAVPGDEQVAGLAITDVSEVLDHGTPALAIKATAIEGFDDPDVIAEVSPAVALGAPRVTLSDDRRAATFVVPLDERLPVGAKLGGRDATLTLVDGDRALERRSVIAKGALGSVDAASGPSLLLMVAIALLGGLVLNVMPCVLPVLSLKVIALARRGDTPGHARAGLLATAAGIVASFLAIALALLTVKAAGRTIGWGLQFQQPAFIAFMAVVVTLFACNVWGLFEVPAPRFVANAAGRRMGPDTRLAGHFVTGVFATLLATPCTAPFLGTAVGFALAGGAGRILVIFLALGLGLALPYLVVAALPRFATVFPKPGRWMLVVKHALALPLVGTAIWLLSILVAQVGALTAGLVAALLLAIAALLALRNKAPMSRRGFAMPAVAALALAALVAPATLGARHLHASAADDGIAWRAFDRDEIKSLVSRGKTVFVDVTADWCLTCQANARLVLSQGAIAGRLNASAIAMRADWTRPDPEISAYLAQYGRYGIPFNIVYGPSAPSGIVLPELLSTAVVTGALDKASPTERRTSLDPGRPQVE